jgi:hypothetical protein
MISTVCDSARILIDVIFKSTNLIGTVGFRHNHHASFSARRPRKTTMDCFLLGLLELMKQLLQSLTVTRITFAFPALSRAFQKGHAS